MEKGLELERMWGNFGGGNLRLWGWMGVSFGSKKERVERWWWRRRRRRSVVWCCCFVVEGVVKEDDGSVVRDEEGFVGAKGGEDKVSEA